MKMKLVVVVVCLLLVGAAFVLIEYLPTQEGVFEVAQIIDGDTIKRFQTENLIYTIPFVIMGLFRYFYLVYKKELGGSPERILINDKGILATVILWIVTVAVIIY